MKLSLLPKNKCISLQSIHKGRKLNVAFSNIPRQYPTSCHHLRFVLKTGRRRRLEYLVLIYSFFFLVILWDASMASSKSLNSNQYMRDFYGNEQNSDLFCISCCPTLNWFCKHSDDIDDRDRTP